MVPVKLKQNFTIPVTVKVTTVYVVLPRIGASSSGLALSLLLHKLIGTRVE